MAESIERLVLGDSGIEVSRIGYGTYHLREKLGGSDAIDSLARAFDAGVTLFDTSDNYGTEDLIGLAVSEGALPRDEVVIATKTGLATSAQEHLAWQAEEKRVDTSPERIQHQVDKSLRMLGQDVDVIDLYQLHAYDPNADPEGIAQVMDELIAQGKIRSWGVSNYPWEKLDTLLGICSKGRTAMPVSTQPFFNLPEPIDINIAGPSAEGLTTLAHSPLLKGMLTDTAVDRFADAVSDDHPEEIREGINALKELQEYAHEREMTLAQLAMGWVVTLKNTVLLTACTSEEYLADAIAASKVEIYHNDPELSAIRGRLHAVNFGRVAIQIMKRDKIYYR